MYVITQLVTRNSLTQKLIYTTVKYMVYFTSYSRCSIVSANMKIQTTFSRYFFRRKSAIFALFFVTLMGFSLATPFVVRADDCAWYNKDLATGKCTKSFSEIGSEIGDAALSGLGSLVKPLLNGIIDLLGLFINLAASIFIFVLNPGAFATIMNAHAVYEVWTWVRDVLNMFFILMLLFSAFATIFQIDQYHYKKLLLNIVIMALLVNFSWPIARFIVDFFNSMMYFFVNSIFHMTPETAAGGFLKSIDIKETFLGAKVGGSSGDSGIAQLFGTIIAMFIFAMTLLVLALLLLVRLVSLPILVMFSPIGFAGSAFPFTKPYAKKWWDKLIQHASYGPIAVFMVLVAMKVLNELQGLRGEFDKIASNVTVDNGAWIANPKILAELAYFAIPIILFWKAIGYAEGISKDVSGTSISFGTKWTKQAGKWAMAGTAGAALLLPKYIANKKGLDGIPGGVKNAWENRKGFGGKDYKTQKEKNTAIWEARAANPVPFLHTKSRKQAENAARRTFDAKKVAEKMENHKKLNVSDSDLRLDLDKAQKDPLTAKAAALTLAEREAFRNSDEFLKAMVAVGNDVDSAAKLIKKMPKEAMKISPESYKDIINTAAMTPELREQFDNRLKKESKHSVIAGYRIEENKEDAKAVYEDLFGKMSAESLSKQDADMLKSPEFASFMKTKSAEYRKAAYQQAQRNASADVVAAWAAEDFDSEQKSKAKQGPAIDMSGNVAAARADRDKNKGNS